MGGDRAMTVLTDGEMCLPYPSPSPDSLPPPPPPPPPPSPPLPLTVNSPKSAQSTVQLLIVSRVVCSE